MQHQRDSHLTSDAIRKRLRVLDHDLVAAEVECSGDVSKGCRSDETIDSGSVDEVVQEMVIRDRRHLSEDGIVLAIIAINRHTGRVETLPEIVSRGFALAEDGSQFLQTARQIVARTLESSNQEEKGDWGVMKEKIRADLKRYIVKETSRRPLIMPVILEI